MMSVMRGSQETTSGIMSRLLRQGTPALSSELIITFCGALGGNDNMPSRRNTTCSMFPDQRVHMNALADLAAWTRLAHDARDVVAQLHERDPKWESALVNMACACAARFTEGCMAAF